MHWGQQDHDQSRGVNQEQISHWWYPARQECRKQCSLSALCMSVCDHSLVCASNSPYALCTAYYKSCSGLSSKYFWSCNSLQKVSPFFINYHELVFHYHTASLTALNTTFCCISPFDSQCLVFQGVCVSFEVWSNLLDIFK